jgi:hypothetical protein
VKDCIFVYEGKNRLKTKDASFWWNNKNYLKNKGNDFIFEKTYNTEAGANANKFFWKSSTGSNASASSFVENKFLVRTLNFYLRSYEKNYELFWRLKIFFVAELYPIELWHIIAKIFISIPTILTPKVNKKT